MDTNKSFEENEEIYDIIDQYEYGNLFEENALNTFDISLSKVDKEGNKTLLYSNYIDNNGEFFHKYIVDDSDTFVYHLMSSTNSLDNVQFLSLMKKDDFINMFAEDDENSKKPSLFSKAHSFIKTRIIMLDNEISDDCDIFLEQFKKLSIRYSELTSLIPAISNIDTALEVIHSYISTGKLDLEELDSIIFTLSQFSDFCPETFANLKSFKENPQGTDLRELCEFLEKRNNNISKLIDIYYDNPELDDKEKN